MTRQVTFEGRQYNFPDDATDSEITTALEQAHPLAAAQGRGTLTPMTPSNSPSRRGQPAPMMREVGGAEANFNRDVPFINDIANTIAGGVNALPGLALEMTGLTHGQHALVNVPRRFQEGALRQRGVMQGLAQDFDQRRPNAAAFMRGAGGAAPILATMGATGPEAVAAALPRGLLGWGRQTALGAATGATYGAVSGLGNDDADTLPQRLSNANQGMELGAALGAAAPTAANMMGAAVRPAARVAASLWDRIPTPAAAESSVGAFGRPMQASTPPPQLPRLPGPAMAAIDADASRAQVTPDQLAQRFESARQNPQGEVLSDVLGGEAQARLRGVVNKPGETLPLAAEAARSRFQMAPDRILSELNRRLRVAETPEQAIESLNRQYEQVSAENYKPVFAQTLTPEQRAGIERAIAPYADDSVMTDAMRRAHSLFNRDRANGLVAGNIEDNFARYGHYVKMGLDAAIQKAPEGARGLSSTELRGVMQMQSRVVTALDQNIPGYAEARARWGGLREAEEALREGRDMLTRSASSIGARMNEMTPFAQYHARVAFANALEQRIGLRGSVNGNRNVAEALGSPELQRRIAAMFETPEQAAAFLDTLNRQNMLMRNASTWVGGSQTASNLSHGEDTEGLISDTLAHVAGGRSGHAVAGVANAAKNFFTAGAAERSRNQIGEAYLTRIDAPEAKRFTDAVIVEMRRRDAARRTDALAAQGAAQFGGITAGQRRRPN